MLTGVRKQWAALAVGLLLVFSFTGAVGAAAIATILDPEPTTVEDGTATDSDGDADEADTTASFEDEDGDGVDDDCEADAVVADPDAADEAEKAVDTDGDGDISVPEAAHSNRTGGKNCNHGGYVSSVARGLDEACEPADEAEVDPAVEDGDEAGNCDEIDTTASFEDEDGDGVDDDCEEDAVVPDPGAADEAQKAVDTDGDGDISVPEAAHSNRTGGKNCNHGGYVSSVARGLDEACDPAEDGEVDPAV
jgi:hypothetical protein